MIRVLIRDIGTVVMLGPVISCQLTVRDEDDMRSRTITHEQTLVIDPTADNLAGLVVRHSRRFGRKTLSNKENPGWALRPTTTEGASRNKQGSGWHLAVCNSCGEEKTSSAALCCPTFLHEG